MDTNVEKDVPVEIIDPGRFSERETELVDALCASAPDTELKRGDLAYLTNCPAHVRRHLEATGRLIPLIWKVRFVVSLWAYEAHNLVQRCGEEIGLDRLVSLLDAHAPAALQAPDMPVVYAHGFPHGQWPDSAIWMPGDALRKIAIKDPNVRWPEILDEAGAPFHGYDPSQYRRGFVWQLAPDQYREGENIGKPMFSEEETVHTACLLGMEQLVLGALSEGADPYYVGDPKIIDPDDDIFKGR